MSLTQLERPTRFQQYGAMSLQKAGSLNDLDSPGFKHHSMSPNAIGPHQFRNPYAAPNPNNNPYSFNQNNLQQQHYPPQYDSRVKSHSPPNRNYFHQQTQQQHPQFTSPFMPAPIQHNTQPSPQQQFQNQNRFTFNQQQGQRQSVPQQPNYMGIQNQLLPPRHEHPRRTHANTKHNQMLLNYHMNKQNAHLAQIAQSLEQQQQMQNNREQEEQRRRIFDLETKKLLLEQEIKDGFQMKAKKSASENQEKQKKKKKPKQDNSVEGMLMKAFIKQFTNAKDSETTTETTNSVDPTPKASKANPSFDQYAPPSNLQPQMSLKQQLSLQQQHQYAPNDLRIRSLQDLDYQKRPVPPLNTLNRAPLQDERAPLTNRSMKGSLKRPKYPQTKNEHDSISIDLQRDISGSSGDNGTNALSSIDHIVEDTSPEKSTDNKIPIDDSPYQIRQNTKRSKKIAKTMNVLPEESYPIQRVINYKNQDRVDFVPFPKKKSSDDNKENDSESQSPRKKKTIKIKSSNDASASKKKPKEMLVLPGLPKSMDVIPEKSSRKKSHKRDESEEEQKVMIKKIQLKTENDDDEEVFDIKRDKKKTPRVKKPLLMMNLRETSMQQSDKKQKKLRKQKAQDKLRALLWVIILPNMNYGPKKRKVIERKTIIQKDNERRVNAVYLLCKKNILKQAGEQIEDMFNDLSFKYIFVQQNPPKGEKLDQMCTKLCDHFCKIMQKLTQGIPDMNTDLFEFLNSIMEDGAILPADYLSDFEFQRLSFSPFGTLKNMDQTKSKLVIAGFFIFRVLILRILMRPPVDEMKKVKKKALKPERLLNMTSFFYSTCYDLLDAGIKTQNNPKLIRKDSQIHHRKAPLKAFDNLQEDDLEMEKYKKSQIIYGFYPPEQLLCFFSERPELVEKLKSMIRHFLTEVYYNCKQIAKRK